MFSHIKNAIDLACENSRKYISNENAFIRERKWGFKDYMEHIILNKRKTVRNNLDFHLRCSQKDVGTYRKQSFSEQRLNIVPDVFKDISLNYLDNIGYFKFDSVNAFFKTFKGFRLFAGDGSKFTLPKKSKTLKDFKFPEGYSRLPKVVFSGIVDVLNDFIIDGLLGERGIGELKLMHRNLKNCVDLIDPEKSIFIFDRGYVALELIARIIDMDSFFVVRLKNKSYKYERMEMESDDDIISIELTENRLKNFRDPELKEKFSELKCLNLRVVNIELDTGEIESLLTNLPSEMMDKEDLGEIYDARWGIECTYKTLKQRLQIQNYTAYSKIGILQDIYSTFLIYNIFCYSRIYLNTMINRTMRKKGKISKYDVDQSNLITRIKEDLYQAILNPTKENIIYFMKSIIEKCSFAPNKVKEPRKYKRVMKQSKPKYPPNYKPTF